MIATQQATHSMSTILPLHETPEDVLKLYFKPIDVEKNWIRCSTIANFAAAYFQDTERDPALIPMIDTNLLSTVINELVENAAKYSSNREQENALIIRIFKHSLQITVSNPTTITKASEVIELLESYEQAEDLEELYLEKMMNLADIGLLQRSAGLGLLLLKKDYSLCLKAYTQNTKKDDTTLTIEVSCDIFR